MSNEITPAIEPAKGQNTFEQTVKTMEPQVERSETQLPRLPDSKPAPPEQPSVQKEDKDDKDSLSDGIDDQYVAPTNGNARESQAELMVDLAKGFATFFHTPDCEVFASITLNNHLENTAIRSRGFKQWLGRLHYKQVKKPPGAQAVKDALDILEAEGLFDGKEVPLNVRYAEHEDCIYIDLGNENWDQIRIDKESWSVIGSKDSPVKFIRFQGMAAMPIPNHEGNIDLLQHFLNIENESDWKLIVSWLVGSMRPTGPFPILVLQGEQGTAKSTTARFLRDIVDPSTIPFQSLPRSERDLIIAAAKSWVLNFDNLSYLRPLMSDAFCRLSTGGGFRTRALYTDDNERLFNSIRPMNMNGITDITTRHDLADRYLIVQLPHIPKDKRIPEKELMLYWNLTKDKIFGALCNALSVALANVETIKLNHLPRMADFATWVTAAEGAFSWKPGSFIQEYENNRKRLVEITLDADPVAVAVIRMIQQHREHEWSGTASDLLKILGLINPDLLTLKAWPKQPNVLSGRLKRAATSLREMGIEIEWTKSGDRKIHIYRNKNYVAGSLDHVIPENNADSIDPEVEVFNKTFGTDYDQELY